MAASEAERIIAIGDIHGCNTELHLLIESIPIDEKTLLVFLGDYIDRGPQSREVVDTILKLRRHVRVVTLRGNHEAMLEGFLRNPDSADAGLFVLNGGSSTLASYQIAPGRWEIPTEHRQFFSELKYFYETDEYFFVHAGVPNVPLSKLTVQQHGDHMLWIRSSFLESTFKWGKLIIHGHTPVEEVELVNNRINLDTGCVYNGHLSALVLPDMQVYSVPRQLESEGPVALREETTWARFAVRFGGAITVHVAKGAKDLAFETLNYNEHGLLMRESAQAGNRTLHRPLFAVGEKITGRIGSHDFADVQFVGEVIRSEIRDGVYQYALKFDKITVPGDELK